MCRSGFLIAFVLVVVSVLAVDRYTLDQWQTYHRDAEAQYVAALAEIKAEDRGVKRVVNDLLDVRREVNRREQLQVLYAGYLDRMVETIREQQAEAKRLNGLIDDYTNLVASKCEEVSKWKDQAFEYYETYRLALEFITKARALFKQYGIAAPVVEYDGTRVLLEGN